MLLVIKIILFLLSKAQNFMSLSSHYPQKTIKNDQNFLAKDLKYLSIGMNIKQKVVTKIRQVSIDIFLNQTLYVLTDCLFILFKSK